MLDRTLRAMDIQLGGWEKMMTRTLFGAAFNGNLSQRLVPSGACGGGNPVETPVGYLAFQVAFGSLHADKRNA